MKSSLVLLPLIILSGCASVPKSVDELRTAGKAKSSFALINLLMKLSN